MPEEVARELFKVFVKDQKEAAHAEGTDRIPELFGEILLEREKTDEEVKNAFAPKRADGTSSGRRGQPITGLLVHQTTPYTPDHPEHGFHPHYGCTAYGR